MAGRLPPHRQGHHPLPLRVLAGDADVGRHRPAAGLGRRRVAAARRREDDQDDGQRRQAARPGRHGRRRRVPLLLPRRHARSGTTATSPTSGLVDRYNADLANNLGNLRRARGHGRRRRSAAASARRPAADSPLAAVGRRRRRRRRRGVGRRRAAAARSTPRGARSGRPTPTSRPTSRGSSSPARGSTPCSATPSRRCASSPSWPRRRSRRRPRRSGSASGCPARSPTSGCPADVAWGGYPGGLPVDEGRRRCSRASSRDRPSRRSARTLHCHHPRRDVRPADERRRRGRGRRGVDDDGHGRAATGPRRWQALAIAAAHPDVHATVGLHPHDAATASTPSPTCSTARSGRSPSASAGSTTTTTTRRATSSARRSPPRSPWPTGSACRS